MSLTVTYITVLSEGWHIAVVPRQQCSSQLANWLCRYKIQQFKHLVFVMFRTLQCYYKHKGKKYECVNKEYCILECYINRQHCNLVTQVFVGIDSERRHCKVSNNQNDIYNKRSKYHASATRTAILKHG